MRHYLQEIEKGLSDQPVRCQLLVGDHAESLPILEIQVYEATLGRTAWDVCRRLRSGKPPVQVGHGKLDEGKLVINPLHLNESRTTTLLRRLREELS